MELVVGPPHSSGQESQQRPGTGPDHIAAAEQHQPAADGERVREQPAENSLPASHGRRS
jgi:hypothetical protein